MTNTTFRKSLCVLIAGLASTLPSVPVFAAELFAPGVTKESGWYDVNKVFDGDDNGLCWAATASNVIDVSEIFQNFKTNWTSTPGGYLNMDGVNWYFTGKFSSNTTPPELEIPNSGGYLSHLDGVGTEAWGLIDIHDYKNWGNRETGKLFFDMRSGDNFPDQTRETFSKIILEQLALGVSMISVHKVYGTYNNSGHSITLWGCEYDEETKLVNKIYVTDSDDASRSNGKDGLKAYEIVDSPDGKGIMMGEYYYNQDQFGRITTSTMLYAAYIPEPSAFGLIAGVISLVFFVSRRRRK